MLPKDESKLISDLKNDDIKAFEKIFSLYHKRIYNFCRGLHQSSDDAVETVQKVFVALWEQRSRVDENKSFASYLYGIAKNIIYQDFRHGVYKKAAFDNFILDSSHMNESTKDEVLYNELVIFLEAQIESMPERQREIFRLSRSSGITYRQIADQLGISENTVDTQIRRALVFLREKYNTYFKEY